MPVFNFAEETVLHILSPNASGDMLTLLLDYVAGTFAVTVKKDTIPAIWARNRVPCLLQHCCGEDH